MGGITDECLKNPQFFLVDFFFTGNLGCDFFEGSRQRLISDSGGKVGGKNYFNTGPIY
jgi:hypothetical protein